MTSLAQRRPVPRQQGVLLASLRDQLPIVVIIGGYCALVLLLTLLVRGSASASIALYSEPFILLFCAFAAAFFIGHPVQVMVFKRPARLTRTILREWRQIYLTPKRLGQALPVLLFLPPFISAFTLCKTLIPDILPFAWDLSFAEADPYQPLMAYLRGAAEVAPVWALEVQDALWRAYEGRGVGTGAGISAMPSMHVACAVLLVLLGRRRHALLGWAFAVFAGFILLGSVHLGWHYAIDGYVAIPLTLLVWRIAGIFTASAKTQNHTEL